MRAISLFSLFLLLLINTAYSQSVISIQFEKELHEFGTVQEEDGPLTYEFKFKNTGAKPVKITDVDASCGCTTPSWTKEAVAPGEEGYIQAQYNPYNRPGSFYKNLTVKTDAGGEPIKLYIKGVVVPKAKAPEEELTISLGDLRVKHKTLNIGKVFTKDSATEKSFEIYNAGKKDVIIKKIIKPAHIEVIIPDTLKPQDLVSMKVLYDGKAKKDLGFFNENLSLITNEPLDSIKSFTLFTNVEEYFPPMSKEEYARIPRMSFGDQGYDFGRVKQGDTVKTSYDLINVGQSVLNIRKIEPNCSCVTARLLKNDLNPGESTTIELIFDTSDRRGNQQKALTVYSNDTSSPVQRLTIKGYVESGEDSY